jgi:hypothetical protein
MDPIRASPSRRFPSFVAIERSPESRGRNGVARPRHVCLSPHRARVTYTSEAAVLLPLVSLPLPLPGAGGFHRAAEYVIIRGVNNLVSPPLSANPAIRDRSCVRVRLISST